MYLNTNHEEDGSENMVGVLLIVLFLLLVAAVFFTVMGRARGAGVPKLRPLLATDVDLEVNRCLLENGRHKDRLVRRLNALLKRPETQANAKLQDRIRVRLLVLDSVSEGRRWDNEVEKGLADVGRLLDVASVHGKYVKLERVFHVPGERSPYGEYNDFGHWPGTSLYGQQFPPCNWVYVYPRWYLWRDCTVENFIAN